ncbi:oxidoreductase [Blastomyces dermatitidis ATCC 18188]|nr:oxidoreductase [Blastomyces dermatitidis ATCC 18188]
MDVPTHVKALREEVIKRNGIRQDDIEFTFSKGRWGHLGEATLMNRIKSHPDVGERWYPTLLQKIRDEQAQNDQVAEEPQGLLKEKTQVSSKLVEAH